MQSLSQSWTVHEAVLLKDGRVLVIGGTEEVELMLDSTEVFDPAVGTWSLPG